MAIKFACPQCQNVMTVADNLAGKRGKCKCGNNITVPQPAAPDPVPAARGAMFDELTDADYGRQSPFEKIYSPTKTTDDAATLKRFQSEEEAEKESKSGQLNGTLIFIAVINFIEAVGAAIVAVIFAVATHLFADLLDAVPLLRIGAVAGIAFFSLAAILLFAGGLGLLLKKAWGWFLIAMSYSFAVVDRLVGFGMIFTEDFQQGPFFGALIGLVAVISLAAFVYKSETQQIYQIKTKVPGIVAAVLGVVIAGAAIGTIFALESSAEDVDAAELADGGY